MDGLNSPSHGRFLALGETHIIPVSIINIMNDISIIDIINI